MQFLTRIPVSSNLQPCSRESGISVLYYPLVGVLIGSILALVAVTLEAEMPALRAALLLTVWVALTGGLHLDGLADCADAWAGGLGDRDRTLRILQDPAAGPVAVTVLVLTLMLKLSALQALPFATLLMALLFAPLLGRTAVLVLMISAPYVRKEGLATRLTANLPASAAKFWLSVIVLASLFLMGFVPVFMAGVVVAWLRYQCLQRLGGMTGDGYGAGVELVETAVLLGLALHE